MVKAMLNIVKPRLTMLNHVKPAPFQLALTQLLTRCRKTTQGAVGRRPCWGQRRRRNVVSVYLNGASIESMVKQWGKVGQTATTQLEILDGCGLLWMGQRNPAPVGNYWWLWNIVNNGIIMEQTNINTSIVHLVGGWATPLKNMKVSWEGLFPYIMEHIKYLKPPTR